MRRTQKTKAMNKFHKSLIYRFLNQRGGRRHYLFDLVDRTSDQATFHLRDKGNEDLIEAKINLDKSSYIPVEIAKFIYKGMEFQLRADFYVGESHHNSVNNQAKMPDDMQLDAYSSCEIVKQALNEVAPQSAITVVKSDSLPILLKINIMEGIKLILSISMPNTLEKAKLFASYISSNVKEIINFFFNLFDDNSKETGKLSITGTENDLVISMKINSIPTKGGNFVDLNVKNVKLWMFLERVSILTSNIEKFDSRGAVKEKIGFSLSDSGGNFGPLLIIRPSKCDRQ